MLSIHGVSPIGSAELSNILATHETHLNYNKAFQIAAATSPHTTSIEVNYMTYVSGGIKRRCGRGNTTFFGDCCSTPATSVNAKARGKRWDP